MVLANVLQNWAILVIIIIRMGGSEFNSIWNECFYKAGD